MSPVLAASGLEIVLRVLLGLLLATVVTIVSLRLLGVRRGWMKALFAGVIGWSTAVVVALGLSDWDWGADGLTLHIVVLGVPTTMAVAVALDLLARPGTLAIGDRAGLVVAPRPLRAVRRRISVLRRYRELARLLRREGFGPLLSPPSAPSGRSIRSGSASAACSRMRVASTSSSGRSRPPASTCCRPTCARR